MPVTAPDWLTRHDGALRPSNDGRWWLVCFGGEPQYLLRPVPAAGKHACEVEQSINGKRLNKGGVYPTVEDALRGGLEDLRQALGW